MGHMLHTPDSGMLPNSAQSIRRQGRGLIRVDAVLTPRFLVLAPAVLSLAAWALPGGSEVARGFRGRVSPALPGVMLVTLWYVACAEVASVGARVGQSFPRNHSLDAFRPQHERQVYIIL